MGKTARAGGTEMSDSVDQAADHDKSPDEVRHEIEQAREELGDTVETLAHKADVKAQAKERISSAKGSRSQRARRSSPASSLDGSARGERGRSDGRKKGLLAVWG